MSIYALAHIIHVYCAIAFVGGVFFEMLVLSVLPKPQFARIASCGVERVPCPIVASARNAACRHYPVHQRYHDGVHQPLPADTAPHPFRQLFRHHAGASNPG